jgi:hypothetical protein
VLQSRRALTVSWAGLTLITLLSFAIVESPDLGGNLVTIVVMTAATLKGAIVLVQFMGVRSFPTPWQVFLGLWLVVSSAVIVGFHLAG